MANSFKKIAELSIEFFSEYMEAAYSDIPMVKMLSVFENRKTMVTEGTDEINKGLQAVMEKSIAKKGMQH